MVHLIARIVVNALALMATTVVPGISFHGSIGRLLLAGAVFGLFNLLVRPLALLLSIPLLILSLGLFYFVLNGILLVIASWFMPGYHVATLLAGIIGSLVIGLVNWALHALVGR
jgi:putative membrane protein